MVARKDPFTCFVFVDPKQEFGLMFTQLPAAAPDPILQVSVAYAKDARTDKLDLGVGVFRNAEGVTPVFGAVKAAEAKVLHAQTTKTYVGIGGDMGFVAALGAISLPHLTHGVDYKGVQTIGGTGGVFLAVQLAARAKPDATVFVPEHTWSNHRAIAKLSGLTVANYAYPRFDAAPDINAVLNDLANAQSGDVLVLHATCHNPTGIDFPAKALGRVLSLAAEKDLFVIVDAAYLGFGVSFDADAKALEIYDEHLSEYALVVSCSKNFGLYRDRVGACFFRSKDADALQLAFANVLDIARSSYSMPADHGAAVVREILTDDGLKADWLDELAGQRDLIAGNRAALANALDDAAPGYDWTYLRGGQGMFAIVPITPQDVAGLAEVDGIYMVPFGRVNVAAALPDKALRIASALSPRFGPL